VRARKLLKNMKRHLKVTIIYCLSFLLIGLNVAAIGPILLDLLAQVNSDLDSSGWLFTARSLGYFLGSLLAGWVIEKFAHIGNTFVAVCMMLAGICTAVIPFLRELWIVCAMLFAVGLGMGSLDCAANVMLIFECKVVKIKVDPYMQALHAAFAVGAFLSPILVELVEQWTSFGTALWIIASLFLPLAIIVYSLGAVRSLEAKGKSSSSEADVDALIVENFDKEQKGGGEEEAAVSAIPKFQQWFVVLSGGLYLMFYVGKLACVCACVCMCVCARAGLNQANACAGTEIAAGGFIDAFGQTIGKFGPDASTFLNAGYWATFSAGRIAAIFVSIRVSPSKLLVGAMTLSLIALAVPIVFGVTLATMWICMGLFGLALAPCFPSMFNYIEQHMPLQGAHASALSVGSSFGEMLIPMAMTFVFAEFSLRAFLVCLAVSSGSAAMALLLTMYAMRRVDAASRRQQQQRDVAMDEMTDVTEVDLE
jgi:FHS family Na+ dependent glucose MFS transporter 1